MYVLERGSLYRRSNSGLKEHSSGIIIAVRASAAVVTELGDPDMIRNSQRLSTITRYDQASPSKAC